MTDYGPEFEAFWSTVLHRPGMRPKKEAYAYWTGFKPLKDGSRIEPGDWPDITRGAMLDRDSWDGSLEHRMNAARWLYNGLWEGALEEGKEREQRTAQMTEEQRQRQADWEMMRGYKAWVTSLNLMPGQRKPTMDDYKAHLASKVVKIA